MVAEMEVRQTLEAIPFERLAGSIDPFVTCPACGALAPSCLGIKAAWEHTCKWEDAHEALRLRVSEIVSAELAGRPAHGGGATLGDQAVGRVLEALGFQVESGATLPSVEPAKAARSPATSATSSSPSNLKKRPSPSSSSSSGAPQQSRRGDVRGGSTGRRGERAGDKGERRRNSRKRHSRSPRSVSPPRRRSPRLRSQPRGRRDRDADRQAKERERRRSVSRNRRYDHKDRDRRRR
uniref:Uncharacterized protein n=1 Tax=Alexandrium catenella TaxID=2925 RepID=A0A7S1L798_ALECA